MLFWRFGGKGSLNQWISDEGVCRTALATPGEWMVSRCLWALNTKLSTEYIPKADQNFFSIMLNYLVLMSNADNCQFLCQYLWNLSLGWSRGNGSTVLLSFCLEYYIWLFLEYFTLTKLFILSSLFIVQGDNRITNLHPCLSMTTWTNIHLFHIF